MTREHASYLAEKFLQDYQCVRVEKRLAFDAWSDRQRLPPETKRQLWKAVRTLSRRQE